MALLFSPWFWLAVLLSAGSIFGTGYYYGGKHTLTHEKTKQLEAEHRVRKIEVAQAKIDQKTAQEYEVVREKVRTVYVTVKEKANENIDNNPGYAECGLDADGLRLYNAKPGTNATLSTSGLDSPMSRFASRNQWTTRYDSGEQSGTLRNVLRLPGASQGFVGMGNPFGADQSGRLAGFAP